MPEGDAVFRTAARLDATLRGHALVRTEFRWPSLAAVDLASAITLEVVARGKHILHRLDSGQTLHSHLRMEGSWRVRPVTGPVRPGPDTRALLVTATVAAKGERLGMLDLVRTSDEHTLVGHLGPDPLGPDWDIHRAIANLRAAGDRPIGAALLDQRILAGVGTMWDAETLFMERVDPWALVADLPVASVAKVVARAARLLQANRTSRLPTATMALTPTGSMYVHGRHNQPCRRCGTLIRVEPIGEPPYDRVMFFCPACQSVHR